MKPTEFKITPFKNPSGNTVYRVAGWLSGKRIRENHPTEGEALTAKQNYEREVLNIAPLPAITTKLSAAQVDEAEFCFCKLDRANPKMTMTEAIDFALRNYRPVEKQITVSDAYPRFIADKDKQKESGLAKATKQKYDDRLKLLRQQFGKRFVHELTPEQLEPLVDREGSGAWNRKTDHACLTAFFNWAIFRKFRAKGTNPMDEVPCMEVKTGEPVVLTLAQSRAVMEAAQTFQNGSMVPYVTFALFCGMRPEEIQHENFTWDLVDLVEKQIRITDEIAKTRSRRLVAIPDNAVQFLLPHKLNKTPITANRYRCRKLRKLAKLPEPWEQDTYRHTAISFRFAELLKDPTHKNETWAESVVADWSGNSPKIIHKHYRALVKDSDIKEFWNIKPGKKKIVRLNHEDMGQAEREAIILGADEEADVAA